MPSKLSKITQPFLYEINAWPWLEGIGRTEGRAIDLASVPDRYWDEIADLGFDGVWLMGVWQRSPAGIAIALANEVTGQLQRSIARLAKRRRGGLALLRTRLYCR
jgi:hypothetical protein